MLEKVLHEQIPITSRMGIEVTDFDGIRLTLRADFGCNTNVHGTAFAGSLYSLAVLSGWGLLYLKLGEDNMHPKIVVHEGSIKYKAEVVGMIEASCVSVPVEYDRFKKELQSRSKARIQLTSSILSGDHVAVLYSGEYIGRLTN